MEDKQNKKQFECPDGAILIMTHNGLYEVGTVSENGNAFYLYTESRNQDDALKLMHYKTFEHGVEIRWKLINWLSEF